MSTRSPRGGTPARPVTQADLDGFAAVSGDDNPIHTDPDFAASTPFQVPVAHGMFLFALVRAELQRRWPEARLREQSLRFCAPTPVGSAVTISLEELPAPAPPDPSGGDRPILHVVAAVTTTDGSVGLAGTCVLDLAGDR